MTHYRAALRRLPAGRAANALRSAESIALVLGAAVVTAVSAQVSVTLPASPIPFTLQPVAVLLTGAVLGARLGALSQVTYLALGIAGASAFAWSPVLLPGVARLAGPTGGFLLAFPVAAFVVGLCADRGHARRASGALVSMLAGMAVLYAGGSAWASVVLGAGAGPALMAPYVAADLVKLACIAPVVPAARRLLTRP
ncbi:MAG: biotin transporter BioY [Vicinamibacterales bacterium]